MNLEEYLKDNGVTLWQKRCSLYEPQQTNCLGSFDYTKGLENILGKMVKWSGFVIIAQMKTQRKNRFGISNPPRLL